MYPQGVCRIRKPAHAGNGCAIFPVFDTDHGRRRFIQRFLSEPAEKQPVGAPRTLFSPDASSLTSARKQRRETAYKMADAILQETVGVFSSK